MAVKRGAIEDFKRTTMGRTFKHNPSKYTDKYKDKERHDWDGWDIDEKDTLLDDSQLTSNDSVSANSDATGDLSISKSLSNQQLSSKARKKADKQFRKQRRHDDRQ